MSDSEERFQHSVLDLEDKARLIEMEQDAAIQAMDEEDDNLQQGLDQLRDSHDGDLFVFGSADQQLPAVSTPPPGLQDPWRQKEKQASPSNSGHIPSSAQSYHLGTPEGRAEQKMGWSYTKEEWDTWNAGQSSGCWRNDGAASLEIPAAAHIQSNIQWQK
eukprot:10855056-Karenia_brevis.AAC.1